MAKPITLERAIELLQATERGEPVAVPAAELAELASAYVAALAFRELDDNEASELVLWKNAREDYCDEAGQLVLWQLSTKLLEKFTELCRPMQLPGAEALGVLAIAVGRFFGRVGYRSYSEARSWEAFASEHTRTFFSLGFRNERASES